MTTLQHEIFLVEKFIETKSIVQVQRLFRKEFNILPNNKDFPSKMRITRLWKKFKHEGTVKTGRKKGLVYKTDKKEQQQIVVRNYLNAHEVTSVRHCSKETGLKRSVVHHILKKEFHMKPFKYQILQEIKESDYEKRVNFSRTVLERGEDFLQTMIFSHESMFHLSGKVCKHNLRIWGTEKPTDKLLQHVRNSPKLNVICAMSVKKIYGPFFFENDTVKAEEYLSILRNAIDEDEDNFVFQQDGAPPHWALDVRAYLNHELANRWVGRAAAADDALLLWPPRSPDLTPLDFFLWGFVKGKVYYPPLATSIDELKERIRVAVTQVTPELLKKVWGNMARRLQMIIDVKGQHFENLKF